MKKSLLSYKPYIIAAILIIAILIIIAAVLFIILFMVSKPGPCSSFTSAYEKDQCRADYAILNSSLNDCSTVKNLELREYCISEIGISMGNVQVCSLLLNDSRDACISSIAEQKRDISVCNSIQGGSWKDICLHDVSIMLNNSGACYNIFDVELHDDCIINIISSRHDVELCKTIIDNDKMNSCIRDVAIALNEPSLCRYIQNGLYRDSQCFKRLAQLKKDRSICEMISYMPIRINCYENVLGITLVDPKTRKITNAEAISKYNLTISPEYIEQANITS